MLTDLNVEIGKKTEKDLMRIGTQGNPIWEWERNKVSKYLNSPHWQIWLRKG